MTQPTGTSVLCQISADPADINVYPEYDSDPRVVQNLLDGVNRTRFVEKIVEMSFVMILCHLMSFRDDLHMWLAPFTAGQKHIVCIEFFKAETIAMIRVWVRNAFPLFLSLYDNQQINLPLP